MKLTGRAQDSLAHEKLLIILVFNLYFLLGLLQLRGICCH